MNEEKPPLSSAKNVHNTLLDNTSLND